MILKNTELNLRTHTKFWICLLFVQSTLYAKLPELPHGALPSQYFQFWFLYENEMRPGQTLHTFRPFYSIYRDDITAYKFQSSLFPVFYREETNHWHTWTILFFITGVWSKHDDLGDDDDLQLTPLFLWGRGDTQRERYVAFFPFYGKIYNRLSYSEVRFILFPFYSEWKHKEYEATGIFWPFYMRGESPTRKDIRIFPFYSRKKHEGKYERNVILWPFFQWGRENMDKKEPFSYGMFWPFYLWKDSDEGLMKARAYLWFPILSGLFAHGYDKKVGQYYGNLFYFFLQFGTSNNGKYEKLIVFPIFGRYKNAGKETRFYTPFYFEASTNKSYLKSNMYFFLPWILWEDEEYPSLGKSAHYFKIWPLFKYENDSEGNLNVNAFTFFPLRQQQFEHIWDPIVSVFEYKTFTNGQQRYSFLFRLFSYVRSPNTSQFSIPFLVEWKKEMRNDSFEPLEAFENSEIPEASGKSEISEKMDKTGKAKENNSLKSKWSYDFFYGFLGYDSEKGVRVLWIYF